MGKKRQLIRFVIASTVLGSLLFAYVFLNLPGNTPPFAVGLYQVPTWSPNGEHLAFTFDGETGLPELWLFETETRNFHKLEIDYGESEESIWAYGGLAWQSNDTLWFISCFDRCALNWANIESLQTDRFMAIGSWPWDSFAINPAKPNEMIYSATAEFSTVSNPVNEDLYLLDLNNRNITQLTDTPEIAETDPRWSPDGEFLAYVGKDMIVHDWVKDIPYVVNAKVSPGIYRFTWSPNAQWLLYRDGNRDLSIAPLDDQGEIASIPPIIEVGPFYEVSWSPEGPYVAYTSVGDMQGNKLYIDRVDELGLGLPMFQDRIEDQ